AELAVHEELAARHPIERAQRDATVDVLPCLTERRADVVEVHRDPFARDRRGRRPIVVSTQEPKLDPAPREPVSIPEGDRELVPRRHLEATMAHERVPGMFGPLV